MLTQFFTVRTEKEAKQIQESLKLNWDEGYPLRELFGGVVEDKNLLLQIRTALQNLSLLDYRLQEKPDLRNNENFIKELKKALHCFQLLIPYERVAFTKLVENELFYLEFPCHKPNPQGLYVIKDYNLYFK
jgi:hypothetical protein